MSYHILIVEDDTDLREIIADALEHYGYQVTQAINGEAALRMLSLEPHVAVPYDIVITDIVMGAIDGVEVLHAARSRSDGPEVILITAHGSLESAIAAVRLGAFDYMLKPCAIPPLLERIEAAMQQRTNRLNQAQAAEGLQKVARIVHDLMSFQDQERAAGYSYNTQAMQPDQGAERYLWVGRLQIDSYRHEVWFDNQPVHVTPTEYALLAFLAATPGRVASYRDILKYTHGHTADDAEAHELLGWHVRNLRSKLDRRYIISVRRVGYMLIDPDEGTDKET